jgi:hypothetical protein
LFTGKDLVLALGKWEIIEGEMGGKEDGDRKWILGQKA